MTENTREWNFDPPPGITDREVGLAALLDKIRYDLTAIQGKLSEAMRQVAELDLPEPGERTSFMNGPVTANQCPSCGVGGSSHTADCLGICVQTGCDKPATKRVDTNYGYLGNVCDEHHARLLEIAPPAEEPT